MKTTAIAVLKKSLAALKRRGPPIWIQGRDFGRRYRSGRRSGYEPVDYAGFANCFCARGLIKKFASNSESARIDAQGFLGWTIPSRSPSITVPDYNDAKNRTFEQIVRWFERALKLAIASEKT